jgi:predicted esterase YcpF (UPF0227 family)
MTTTLPSVSAVYSVNCKTFLLLHSYGQDEEQWTSLKDYLKREPGRNFQFIENLTLKPRQMSNLKSSIELLAHCIEKEAKDGKVYVIGSNIGGYIAAHLRQKYPCICLEQMLATGVLILSIKT